MPRKRKEEIICCSADDMNLPNDIKSKLVDKGGFEGIMDMVPERGYLNYESDRFHSLSDPIRMQILYSLNLMDMCPCMLKKITDLSDSKLSYHLGILEKAGLIASRQVKNWRIYSLSDVAKPYLTRSTALA